MEDEHEADISFPDYGFYSVQDESHRRYSRTGKHRILAQKYDPSLMKYRYSDETEKSSPYNKTQSDSESPSPSDSPGSYQGVYSPQLAQRNGIVRGSLWNSSSEPRRSLIEEESVGTWISPGVHPGITGPFEKEQYPVANLITNDQQFDSENVGESDSSPEDNAFHRGRRVNIQDQHQSEWLTEETYDESAHREPPPPYSVAVRSSMVSAPRSYLDIAPQLTKDLQGLPDIDKLLEDLEGSEHDQELPHRKGELGKNVDKPQAERTILADESVWAELVHIDDSEDENALYPSSGTIIEEKKETRASSPDRHIRFALEERRATSGTEDAIPASENINWTNPDVAEYPESNPYDTEVGGVSSYKQHQEEEMGLTPLADEVFSYPSPSANKAPVSEVPEAYGIDNPGYANNIEVLDYNTSVDRIHISRPVSSDHVRRSGIDWFGNGPVYDSSQSSTLDSVFTERSWSSDIARPRAFRQKRRVYPKPRDPVGDLGDGLKSKPGKADIDKENDRLHQNSSVKSPIKDHIYVRGHSRGQAPPSRGKHGRPKAQEDTLRRSIVKRELELFMERKTGKNNRQNGRRLGSYDSRRPLAGNSHSSRSKTMSTRPQRPQQRTKRRGENVSNNHSKYNPASFIPRQNPRTFSDEHPPNSVSLRNSGPRGKKDRPLTYPNDVNRSFSQLISREDNNYILNDLSRFNSDGKPSEKLRENPEPRQSLASKHVHNPGRLENIRPRDQRHHQAHAGRRPTETKGNMSQLPPKPQRHIRRNNSNTAGHIHSLGKPPRETQPTHERHHQYTLPNDRTREENRRTSMSSPVEVMPQSHRLEPPTNKSKIMQRSENEGQTRADIEMASPSIDVISEAPQYHQDPEIRPDSNNNLENQQGEQTPGRGKKTDSRNFSNYRFFSVMAAIWFFPIGVWALRKSHQVDSRVKAKDLLGARRASRSARNHAIAAFIVLGFIVLILLGRLIEITIDPRKTFIQYYKIVPDEVDGI